MTVGWRLEVAVGCTSVVAVLTGGVLCISTGDGRESTMTVAVGSSGADGVGVMVVAGK